MKTLVKARNIILHILFLLLLFVGAVLFFERTINRVAPDAAEVMADSTFPLVYMERGDVLFNCLHGFSREMDHSFIRDTITPLSSQREIGIAIRTFGASIEKISYEVLTLDGEESLENTQVIKTETDNEYVRATLKLQSTFLMNQEYLLKLCLVSGGRPIWYYTHVLLMDGLHADEYLNFVSGFYDKTVNGTDLASIGAAVEPDETTDIEGTLAFMDIHDSVDQLTWGQLHPQMYYKPTPRIAEINTHTGTLTTSYRISAMNENGVNEVFNVKEYYRVRYTDSRVFLLNFERTTDEVPNPENNMLEESGIRLGITGKDVVYDADERGRVVAFVQENELWSLERATSKLTQVFSFPQKENMDARDFYDAHKIRILHVSTDGDIWFTVTGHMNRGDHEGDNGIGVYLYDAAADTVDERIFIETAQTGELLQRDVDSLSYLNEERSRFYVLLQEKVYQIDLNARSAEVIAEQVLEDAHAVSPSGRYFAYLAEGEPYASKTLNVIDLESLVTRQITSGQGECIKPLCYMNDDLVYGLAREEDIAIGSLAVGLFPMYRLVFENAEGQAVKIYEPEGMLVTGVEESDHMLTLYRAVRTLEGTLVRADSDEIMDMNAVDSAAMGTATKMTDRKQTIVYLRVGGTISDTSPEVIRSKIIKYISPRIMEIPVNLDQQSKFLAYAHGGLQDCFVQPNEAVASADANVGVVVTNRLDYVWVRGDRPNKTEIPLDQVPQSMRGGATDAASLAEGEEGTVLDLRGCTLDQVLYFVGHGHPVQVVTVDGPRTIVGYDEYNTYLLRPGEEEWFYYGMNDSTELFEQSGNQFYTIV